MSNSNNHHHEQDRYTFPDEPPVSKRQRRSFWAEVFDECRESPGEWRRVAQTFKKSTALQFASDVRSVWRRDPAKLRMRGLYAGERWESKAVEVPDGSWALYLRFMGRDGEVTSAVVLETAW